MKYWLGKNGQQLGPYELADLERMAASGELNAADLAWTQGMAAWAPVFEVVKPAAPPAPTPPPPARAEPAPTVPVMQAYTPAQPYQPAPQPAPPPPAALPPPAAQPYVQQQPQYAQPQPQYGQPQPYAQPQYAQPQQYMPQQGAGAPMMVGGPVPPNLHWVAVWLIGAITFGIFMLIWIFKQANFVQTIDPSSSAKKLYILGFLLDVVYLVLVVAGAAMQNSLTSVLIGIGGLMALGAVVCIIVAHFKMRSSMLGYYNSVENIGLRLSGVMTFFFSILYFQYHFSRIADWKRTGVLRPQQ